MNNFLLCLILHPIEIMLVMHVLEPCSHQDVFIMWSILMHVVKTISSALSSFVELHFWSPIVFLPCLQIQLLG